MPTPIKFTNQNAPFMFEHVKAALHTGLPLVRRNQEADKQGAIIFALGPSLTARKKDLARAIGYARRKGWLVVAVKEAVEYLHTKHGIVADYAVNMDPGPQEAGRTPALRGVTYCMASVCHPDLYGKMIRHRCAIQVFHSAAGFWVDVPGGKVGEEHVYHALWEHKDFDTMEGGVTVVNRAVSLMRFMGVPRVITIGADFGYRPGHQHYVDFVKAAPIDGGKMSDEGQVDGKEWRTKADLLVSACHIAKLILDGYVTVIGDSLAASLAKAGRGMIDRVMLPPDKVDEYYASKAPALVPLIGSPIIETPTPARI